MDVPDLVPTLLEKRGRTNLEPEKLNIIFFSKTAYQGIQQTKNNYFKRDDAFVHLIEILKNYWNLPRMQRGLN